MADLVAAHHSLYIKCLFITIRCQELRDELLMRNCSTGDDSFHVLTLRLRLSLLRENNCNVEVQREIGAELQLLKKNSDQRYACSVPGCSFTCLNHKQLCGHLKILHGSSTNLSIICQLNGCPRILSSVRMLNLHIKTVHWVSKVNSFLPI